METETYMFQMVVDILLHDMRLNGDIPGGQRLPEEQLDDSAAQCFFSRARHGRLERTLFHGFSFSRFHGSYCGNGKGSVQFCQSPFSTIRGLPQ